MDFDPPLTAGVLIRRYKRFLADITLEATGETVVAHCANPGSMMGLAAPGAKVWLSPNTNPKAKLDWRWELVEADGALVCIHTGRANIVAEEAAAARRIPGLEAYDMVRREVQYGANSRIDLLLTNSDGSAARPPPAYVEVKSVTLRRPLGDAPDAAEFPDAKTARGAKHLDELSAVAADGARAIMLFLIQRGDCTEFRPAADIDPTYARKLAQAAAAGVEILCHQVDVTPDGLWFGSRIPAIVND